MQRIARFRGHGDDESYRGSDIILRSARPITGRIDESGRIPNDGYQPDYVPWEPPMKNGVFSAFMSLWSGQKTAPCQASDDADGTQKAIAENIRANQRSQQKARETEDYWVRQRAAIDGVLHRLGSNDAGSS